MRRDGSGGSFALTLWWSAACVIGLALFTPAAADDTTSIASTADGAVREFRLVRQPLADALLAFAAQVDAVFAAPGAMLAGKEANAVIGAMSPHEALRRLLASTGVSGELTLAPPRTLKVFPAPIFNPANGSEGELDMKK